MARIKQTSRKNGAGRLPVWHPALTTAAEQGAEHLDRAQEAERTLEDGVLYEVNQRLCLEHSGLLLADCGEAQWVPWSPFPRNSRFGILPYAAWHGHYDVVKAFVQEMGADVNGAALVPTESHLHVQHGHHADTLGRARMVATMPATALQIAVWKRDTRMVKLLLEHGASEQLPFLLDMRPPRAGTLFASKAGEWSREGLWCYPPAFRAVVREMVKFSHCRGGDRRRDGSLRWGFNVAQLENLILPVLGRGSMTAWVTPDDELPADDDEDEAGSQQGGSQEEDQE